MDLERKEPYWKTLPGLLTAIAALIGAVTGLVLALHQTGLIPAIAALIDPPETQPAGALDDATKWWLAYGLYLDSSAISGTCEVVIVHYQVPYSENLADDLKKVLDLARWKNRAVYSEHQLSKGLLMKAPPGVPNECALQIRQRLGGVAIGTSMIEALPDASASEYLDGCPGCFEIDIGNDPGS